MTAAMITISACTSAIGLGFMCRANLAGWFVLLYLAGMVSLAGWAFLPDEPACGCACQCRRAGR